ncbi:MAG: hypothetical protein GX335_03715 [Firmicutes bacterium]|nr:hypothetical protein [Bacillota bacterium]
MWVNKRKTLWSNRNGDTWQMPFCSKEGICCGTVVAQIVDPKQCLVRYFCVYSPRRKIRFLVPSSAIDSINGAVRSSLQANILGKLPPYLSHVSRRLEQKIHQTLGQRPYWVLERDTF